MTKTQKPDTVDAAEEVRPRAGEFKPVGSPLFHDTPVEPCPAFANRSASPGVHKDDDEDGRRPSGARPPLSPEVRKLFRSAKRQGSDPRVPSLEKRISSLEEAASEREECFNAINNSLEGRVLRLEKTIARTERCARRNEHNMKQLAQVIGKWMDGMPWDRPPYDLRRLSNAFFDFRLRFKVPVDDRDEGSSEPGDGDSFLGNDCDDANPSANERGATS